MRIQRFTPIQKLFHILLMVTFLLQATTGTARMYIETTWGQLIASPFGGYSGCLVVHKYVGLFMLLLFACHVVYVLLLVMRGRVQPDDALWINRRDIAQFFGHLGWMFGGRHPRFERWTYWEKFDYWAVFWGMVVLGITGLWLYSPLATALYVEGWTLNVALWVHRIEACLAMLHVFVIHFAIAHVRRSAFPMDQTMFCGNASLDHVTRERPAWITRLKAQSRMSSRAAGPAPLVRVAVSYVVGLGAVALGVYLVVGGIMNAMYVNW